jgi:pimeloyl-ACP methyl ester carboxylesterase
MAEQTRQHPKLRLGRLVVWSVVVLLVALVVVNQTAARLPQMPPADGKYISLHGKGIHCFEQPGQGVPVVMIHGEPGSHQDFDPVVAELPGLHPFRSTRPGIGWSKGGWLPYQEQIDVVHELLTAFKLAPAVSSGTRSAARWPSVLGGDTRGTSPA